jgi:hypothetical protein
LALLVLALAGAGCGGAASGERPPASAVTATPGAALVFPRQTALPGSPSYPTARLDGTLVVAEQCLRILATESGTSYLPIWHADFTLGSDQGVVAIRDARGQVLWRVGDSVHIGGGEMPADAAAWAAIPALRQPPPAECPGPYWLVGEVSN